MWPHATAIGGIADHQVIQACIRYKSELIHQRVHTCVQQIHALHQQGPARLLEGWQGLAPERTVAKAPVLRTVRVGLHHQTRLDLVLGGQIEELGAVQQGLESRDGLANQQGFLLPVAPHEGGGRQSAQELQGFIDVHGTILLWKSLNNASLP